MNEHSRHSQEKGITRLVFQGPCKSLKRQRGLYDQNDFGQFQDQSITSHIGGVIVVVEVFCVFKVFPVEHGVLDLAVLVV